MKQRAKKQRASWNILYASSETAEEETADDLEEASISNIFEKLFE